MLNLIPIPSDTVSLSGSYCTLPDTLTINYGKFERFCTEAFALRTEKDFKEGDYLTLKKDSTLPQEGYVLEIQPDHITITAATETGVIWALTTLYSLSLEGQLPVGTIKDSPKYTHRGLSLDCVRHFFSADEVKKIIEHISLHKINVLHWHLSDDQGWRIESRRFPLLHETSKDYYTQKEITEIVEFAHIRGVEIIPEIDVPGHTTGILAAYPQYSCFEKPIELITTRGIFPIILCPGKESTFDFLTELLEEIVPLFPGKRFHLGGDEAPKSEWKNCPHCRKRMEEEGITDLEALQGWFTQRMAQILDGMGKTAICWNDTLKGCCPDNIQLQYWTKQYQKSMENYISSGGEWIFSEMFDLYLDYPHSMNTLKKNYTVSPHFGSIRKNCEGNLLGFEACLWAEHISEYDHLEQQIFPRIIALAERSWSGTGNYKDFLTRLKVLLSTALHKELTLTPEEDWDPTGKKRVDTSLSYMETMFSGTGTESVSADAADDKAAAKSIMTFYLGFATKFFKPWDLPKLLKFINK